MTVRALADAPAVGRLGRGLIAVADRLAALTGWRRLAAAIAMGAVASLAMPPVSAAPILLPAFVAFLWMFDGIATARGAFAAGWAFGFGYFVFGLYWIAFALAVDLASFFWMIPFAAAGLPAFLGLFTGAATWALAKLRMRGARRALAFALLWALAEWLRGHVLTGFPWNLLGYAWFDWTPVLQGISVFGIYGLSLLTVLAAALPAAAVDRHRAAWSRPGLLASAAALLALATVGAGGALRLAQAETGSVPGVTLRLVQPDIAQADKWVADLWVDHFRLHLALSSAPGAEGVTHVIWPETAVPYRLAQDRTARRAIGQVAPPGGLVLTGAPRTLPPGEPQRYWNSLFAVTPEGDVAGTYDKAHLVPFGEYVPLRGILPIDRVVPGREDYSAGPGPRTLDLPGLPPVGPLICYEAIFPGAVTDPREGARRPEWLLNVTNDAWYGETAGPHQHFAIAAARAVEEGMPLVRAATTGISGVVDSYGRVVARLGLGERGVVDSPLPQALENATLYARVGDLFFWLVWASGAGLLWLRGENPKDLAYSDMRR
jgi:apolipoprotein N-acyltransferase